MMNLVRKDFFGEFSPPKHLTFRWCGGLQNTTAFCGSFLQLLKLCNLPPRAAPKREAIRKTVQRFQPFFWQEWFLYVMFKCVFFNLFFCISAVIIDMICIYMTIRDILDICTSSFFQWKKWQVLEWVLYNFTKQFTTGCVQVTSPENYRLDTQNDGPWNMYISPFKHGG